MISGIFITYTHGRPGQSEFAALLCFYSLACAGCSHTDAHAAARTLNNGEGAFPSFYFAVIQPLVLPLLLLTVMFLVIKELSWCIY